MSDEKQHWLVVLSALQAKPAAPEDLTARAKGIVLALEQTDVPFPWEVGGQFEDGAIRLNAVVTTDDPREALGTVIEMFFTACSRSPLVGGPSIPEFPAVLQTHTERAEPPKDDGGLIVPGQ